MELSIIMYTYTSEFDKTPLTSYGYVRNESPFIQKKIVAYYKNGVYYVERDEYYQNINSGYFISGSENLNFRNFSLTEDISGDFWLASENNNQIAITQHTTGIEEVFLFSGKNPQIFANATVFSGDERLSCFYIQDNDLYIRSNEDGFVSSFPVVTGKNISKLYDVRILNEPYTGYLGIFCERLDNTQIMYLNNFNLYPPLYNYPTVLFNGFDDETEGEKTGILNTQFYSMVTINFVDALSISFQGFDDFSGMVTFISGVNKLTTGVFI